MAALDKRIEALEATAGVNRLPVLIVRRIVDPGHLEAPISRISLDGEIGLVREIGECEEEFIGRAAALAGYPHRAMRLIAE